MTMTENIPQFLPFRLRRGVEQTISLAGARVDGVARATAARGRETYFEPVHEYNEDGGNVVRLTIPNDAIQGYYNLILRTEENERKVFRNAFMILDPEHHDGRYPMLPEYERWRYVIDAEGVPMKDMAGSVGFVQHPLVVSYFMSEYHTRYLTEPTRTEFRDGAIRLLNWFENALSEGPQGSLLIRHKFPLESFDLPPGWISGLTQGRVAECFLKGAALLEDDRYADLARRMMEILRVPVDEGGLLATDALGCVAIEEYPSEPASWALNGIGSAIASLENIAYRVGIPWAEDLIERVSDGLEEKIRLFDFPDYPGSKVQLALKHRVAFSFTPKDQISIPWRRPSAPRLRRIDAHPALDAPYALDLKKDQEDGLVLQEKPTWLEFMIDGNIDVENESAPRTTRLSFDVDTPLPGVFEALIKDGADDVVLLKADLPRGRENVSIDIDWDKLLKRGVGRVAKHDEYYHETNLAWMWHLSRYGAKPKLLHAARRWLLSFHAGVGRLPIAPATLDRTALLRERDTCETELRNARGEDDAPWRRTLQCKIDNLNFVLRALDGDVASETAYASPRKLAGRESIAFGVYGYGFKGDERIAPIPGDTPFPYAEAALTVVSGDELSIQLAQRTRKIVDGETIAFCIQTPDGAALPGGEAMRITLTAC